MNFYIKIEGFITHKRKVFFGLVTDYSTRLEIRSICILAENGCQYYAQRYNSIWGQNQGIANKDFKTIVREVESFVSFHNRNGVADFYFYDGENRQLLLFDSIANEIGYPVSCFVDLYQWKLQYVAGMVAEDFLSDMYANYFREENENIGLWEKVQLFNSSHKKYPFNDNESPSAQVVWLYDLHKFLKTLEYEKRNLVETEE